jgi:hypothetical protein
VRTLRLLLQARLGRRVRTAMRDGVDARLFDWIAVIRREELRQPRSLRERRGRRLK